MKNKVKLDQIIKSGNAFAIMGAFRVAAKQAGWSENEIKETLDDAMSSDYDHLLDVILNNCEPTTSSTHDEWSFDFDDYDNYDNDVHFDDDYETWR